MFPEDYVRDQLLVSTTDSALKGHEVVFSTDLSSTGGLFHSVIRLRHSFRKKTEKNLFDLLCNRAFRSRAIVVASACEQLPVFYCFFTPYCLDTGPPIILWDTVVSSKMWYQGTELKTPHVPFLSQFLKGNINPREMLKEYSIEYFHAVHVNSQIVNILPCLLYFPPYMCMIFCLKLWYWVADIITLCP